SLLVVDGRARPKIYTLSLHDALPIYGRGAAGALGRAGEGSGGARGGADRGRAVLLRRGGPQGTGRHERRGLVGPARDVRSHDPRSEEHTSELQSREKLVCRLLLEKNR